MPSVTSSSARLKEQLSTIIESKELAISNLQKEYLRSRWLEQMFQLESKYNRAVRSYYTLRLVTVLGCITVLVLVSLSINWQGLGTWAPAVRALTVISSLLVAVSVAIEHLFNFSERYQRYERIAGRLKAEGWRFLQLSGSYQYYKSHSEAFPIFANQVEALSQRDVEVYNFDVIHERKVEAGASEVEAAKKFDNSAQESTELIETPVMMRSVVKRHVNPQRTQ